MQLAFLAAITALASWLASFGTRWLAVKTKAVAQPLGGRRIHDRPIPQLGGLGIGLVILVACLVGLFFGWFAPSIKPLQIYGFIAGLAILMIGGYLDDRYELGPGKYFWFPLLASLVIALTGTRISQITNPFGPHPYSFPLWISYVLTIGWLLAVTAATKFADGLDGLVTGQTVIGAAVIGALTLTPSFFQPAMTVLCVIIGAAYLGFLPVNINPAKQFLGEAGSTIAGLSLGFLSIASGAKVATALMAIGLPLADISLVMLNRMRRGVSPFKGDKTHLHFRLLDTGLTQRQAVYLLWLVSWFFGVAALGFQTRGKVVLILLLIVVTLLLPMAVNAWVSRRKV